MPIIDQYLTHIVDHGASDLHLSSDHPPFWRQDGIIAPLGGDALTSDQIMQMLREIMPPHNYNELLESCDTDCAYAIPGVGRFRVNGFKDMNGFGAVFRQIPENIPTFDELNLPFALRDMCLLSKGLVVITGPTGSGKSTTLAAMIDYINNHRTEHIITIEDPIEFVHRSKRCLINQREVHRDTASFTSALRAALREDPDIVLIGEIRDLETMEIAIETAETGHLVLATLHTNTAIATVDRIIDRFPGERQNQIRSMLADTLKGVAAQVLCSRVGGGRVAAFEMLVVNLPVAAMIRESKTHMLMSVMQTSRNLGMQTFNDELVELVTRGVITPEEAYTKAVEKQEIEEKLNALEIDMSFKDLAEERSRQNRLTVIQEHVAILREALSDDPNDVDAISNLAWVLATAPFEEIRNGREATRLAERANSATRGRDPNILAILGAAYAEQGNFRRAISVTRNAIKSFEKDGNDTITVALKQRLRTFESGQPYHDDT